MSEVTQKQEKGPLEAELEVFERLQPELRRENPEGGFVVINGDEVLGVWRDWADASFEGMKKYGDVSFLVRDINNTGEPAYFTRDVFARG